MSKIPTAEEFLYNTLLEGITDRKPDWSMKEEYARNLSSPIPTKNYGKKEFGHDMQPNDTVKAMIEFTKLHLEAQAKAIKKQIGKHYTEADLLIAIASAYPLTNIK